MPPLDIHLEDLAEPTARRATLAHFEGVMLWPDDLTMQRQFMTAAGVEDQRQSLVRRPPEELIGLPAKEYVVLIDAPKIADMREAAKPILEVGVLVGHVLAEIIGRAERGSPWATLSRVRADVARRFSRNKMHYHVSAKSIENAWARLRPAGHLWAAYVARSVLHADLDFPCRADGLETFLATAEVYRRAGEQHRPPGAKTPILDPERMWRVPEELSLPEVTLPKFRLDRIVKIPGEDYSALLQHS